MSKPKVRDDSYYTCSQISSTNYKISKFNCDGQFESDYELIEMRPGDFYCTCPGFHHHSHCRHLTIFQRFQEENLLRRRFVYSFRNDVFSPMLEDLVA